MNPNPKRHLATMLLVVGAVVFGMVLAGGLQWTTAGRAADDPNLSATKLAALHSAAAGVPSFADLAEAVDPAVVSIQAATIEKADSPHRRRGGGGEGVDPFEFFFGPRNRRPSPGPGGPGQGDGDQPDEFRSDAGGSGFVISPDGLVVTNNHVIDGATSVKVHLGERDYTAEVKGADKATDIALLKIDTGRPLRYLELGDSNVVRVGDWIMVVGNPLNLDKTVTTGVISAKGRSIGISDSSFENFLQTDAAINFGNSGGPLINLQGQVVGIATAINAGAENIGFAVPVNTLKDVLPQLREKGKVSRGYLGIGVRNLSYEQAQAWGLPNTDGALVMNVEKGKPAEKAGVQHGDVVVSVDGRKVKTTRDLIDYVSSRGPEASVTLSLWRDGKPVDVKVRLGERTVGAADQSEDEKPGPTNRGIDWLGMDYQDLTSGLRSNLSLPDDVEGVYINSVSPSSPLYEQAIRRNTIITEVNGHPVKNVAEFEKAIKGAKAKSYVRLYALQIGPRGETAPFFAVVQVP
jgi:serine protease Do